MHDSDTEREDRHARRMQSRKAVVDARIDAARSARGVLVVHTGNGKGKSSAAFGVLARALGHGMQVAVVQFIKGRRDTGEEAFFRDHPSVRWHVMGDGFTWETQDRAADIASAEAAWQVCATLLADPSIGLVVLDELCIALKMGYLDTDRVVAALQSRAPMQHVIVTGRGAPPALIDAADTVSVIEARKHAFQAGVQAMPGLEY
ncbi:MAG: cob(I)yrinic acid a,c-diamide adenosyltransferase [Rhodocyclaceae bacterium]|nr:cob(I)yrinic acid a,c-diamide adenosyltransferase [Rhodocyclaceae bacterium]